MEGNAMLRDDQGSIQESRNVCAGLSAVVVDDDEAILKMIVRVVEDLGMSCTSFVDAEAAYAWLTSHPTPDLLTVDVGLPGMSGLTLVRTLRRTGRFSSTRIIVLTARTALHEAITSTRLGAMFFTKPFGVRELRDAVIRALGDPRPRRRVLIVDDDEAIRDAVSNVVRDMGCEAVATSDGCAALTFLRRHAPPDLILLDIGLPSLDGASVAMHLARWRSDRYVPPIVLFSARDDVDREAERVGAYGYLRKPVEVEALTNLIRCATTKPTRQAAD